ncbi:hypothetical protein EHRUM1_07530 [Ehrlichia ruminantium]|nr:hypothetical protein EHRUM1_07530 [Ehrlichia ruminantium]
MYFEKYKYIYLLYKFNTCLREKEYIEFSTKFVLYYGFSFLFVGIKTISNYIVVVYYAWKFLNYICNVDC